MTTPRPEIVLASDQSVLVSFGDAISVPIHRAVARTVRGLRAAGAPEIVDLHPGYASVLVRFDPLRTDLLQLERLIRAAAEPDEGADAGEPRLVEVPVVYGGEGGPDLEDVARHTGLRPQEVVAAHAGAEYLVYFLGFTAGFAYMGGLPDALAIPRLRTPRQRVPAGSVAIAGRQTGIYPHPSPGGWRLIGRTPLRLFDPAADPVTLFRMGDRVRFVPVETQA